MRGLSDLIGAVKARQAVIKDAMASGNPVDWSSYQRLVGEHAGLERTLEIINNLLKEKDEDE
jgi:hypothetical protein